MNSRVNPGTTIMNTGDYQFEAISLCALEGPVLVLEGEKVGGRISVPTP